MHLSLAYNIYVNKWKSMYKKKLQFSFGKLSNPKFSCSFENNPRLEGPELLGLASYSTNCSWRERIHAAKCLTVLNQNCTSQKPKAYYFTLSVLRDRQNAIPGIIICKSYDTKYLSICVCFKIPKTVICTNIMLVKSLPFVPLLFSYKSYHTASPALLRSL